MPTSPLAFGNYKFFPYVYESICLQKPLSAPFFLDFTRKWYHVVSLFLTDFV